jgi:hypothetical protein
MTDDKVVDDGTTRDECSLFPRDQSSNVKLSGAKLLLFAQGSHGLGLSQTSNNQEESDGARGTNTNIQTVTASHPNACKQLHIITKQHNDCSADP